MSLHLINQYYNELQRIQHFSKSTNEDTIKGAFVNLVNGLARPKLELVREVQIKSRIGTMVRPDGILRSILQLDYGYWESKDTQDDLQVEIEKKFNKGYPQNNILFEDTQTAILYQENRQFQIKMTDAEQLLELLHTFINYERPEVAEFNKAIVQFGKDLPNILEKLRQLIEAEIRHNPAFVAKSDEFLKLCQNSIHPNLGLLDMREMLIQHILTEEIFMSIFNNADYHRENNIAQSLYEVERTFFQGQTKQNLLADIRPYYNTVKARANEMISYAEKQKFLKLIYENFYKAYNPEAADRLGIVYTPNEIVDFMIESCDFLLERHFSKTLGSTGVEILDPCTGTGTFVTQLLEHIPPQQLAYKYAHEIHANEMALLPYYVANLNIEAVYQQKMGRFQAFNNLCFVDTLDNTNALIYANKQDDMFGAISLENVARIKRQNQKTISVIIGNPPYNAKQENYNFQNANRFYLDIDKRIKETYIKRGTAQNQIVVYDMYVRFLRWASDRLNKNGIIAFVSNSSFIDSAAFDGFRKLAAEDFNEIWIVDMKGNARTSGERRRKEKGNVFDDKIRVGVAIYFLVKSEKSTGCKVFYNVVGDYWEIEQKRDYLKNNKLANLVFERIIPDDRGNWINQTDNDFDELIPLVNKEVKAGKSQEAIFQLFSSGVKTQRDEWVYDFSKTYLESKIRYFVDIYQKTIENSEFADKFKIKWDRELDRHNERQIKKQFDEQQIVRSLYRPFTKMWFYFDKHFNGMTYQWFNIFNPDENKIIAIPGIASPKDFHAICLHTIIDLNAMPAGGQCLPFYRYEDSQRIENITDWALALFRDKYASEPIQKLDIFHYVYAVLHDPKYRQKYEQNLKRDFPRIPLYDDFWTWATWGKRLMELHLNYEHAAPYPVQRRDTPLKNPSAKPKAKLKADKITGQIEIDEVTVLTGIPAQAWDYKLGNRSALEWILDQYKEKKPSDQTILEHFNTYQFADYKEHVIDLLKKICTVSVETVEIVTAMTDDSEV
ncbi:MAG: type ISP restriction/modification enzyme [Thiotrichaceae bacterium]